MQNKLDLHGVDVKSAEVELRRFIEYHYEMKSWKVEVVTGKGTGAIMKMTKLFLSRSKYVEKVEHSMAGMTYNLGSLTVYLAKSKK